MRRVRLALTCAIALLLGACATGRALPPLASDTAPDATMLHFVSDRGIETAPGGALRFSTRRDPAMSYGVAAPGAGEGTTGPRGVRVLVRFPGTPLPFDVRGGQPVTEPAAARAYDASAAAVRAELAGGLAARGTRDILLYVHGFNSRFHDTMATLARIRAETGRDALPVAFSWPAGNPGLFAYFKDRESGAFSVFHLKKTLRLLASVPGMRRIHVVAHSRGSQVVTTALREMVIAERAAGRDPRRSLGIENLILAAPDLDFSVVRQRLIAEQFGPAFGRITVYINPGDSALGLAQVLLAGVRFGRISFDQLRPEEREIFKEVRNVDFINVSGVAGRRSHVYFSANPDVLRDMAAVIDSGAAPDDPARSLEPDEGNFWRLVQTRDTPLIRQAPDR